MSDGPFSVLSWEQFLPPNAVLMARRVVSSVEIFFEAPGLELADHRELFEKIMGALNLSPSEYRVIDESLPQTDEEKVNTKTFVRFIAAETELVAAPSGAEDAVVVTYSLSAMLKDPNLKKAVWSQLKGALTK